MDDNANGGVGSSGEGHSLACTPASSAGGARRRAAAAAAGSAAGAGASGGGGGGTAVRSGTSRLWPPSPQQRQQALSGAAARLPFSTSTVDVGGIGTGGGKGDVELGAAGASQQEQRGAAAAVAAGAAAGKDAGAAGGDGEDGSRLEFSLSRRQLAVAAGAEPFAGRNSVLTSPVSQRPTVYQDNDCVGGGGGATAAISGRGGAVSGGFGGSWGWEGQGGSGGGGGGGRTGVRNRDCQNGKEGYGDHSAAAARYSRRGVRHVCDLGGVGAACLSLSLAPPLSAFRASSATYSCAAVVLRAASHLCARMPANARPRGREWACG